MRTPWVSAEGVAVQERTAVIVDDQPWWLDAIAAALTNAAIRVLGTTSLLSEAAMLVESLRPSLLVVEIAIRDRPQTGLEWLAEHRSHFAELKVVVCSRNDDHAHIAAALDGAADVYVIKRAHPSDVTAAVRQLYSRSLHLPHHGQPLPPPRLNGDFGLTKRQIEILTLVAQGQSNQQMARYLWVTEQTIKFHLSNIYRKLGVRNRTAASRLAHTHNLASNSTLNRTARAQNERLTKADDC
jgi:DNA-binding NarL/FixJ family response regulator